MLALSALLVLQYLPSTFSPCSKLDTLVDCARLENEFDLLLDI